MCALFGWLDYKVIVSDKLLKKLTQALANAAEERGTDASGIAYVKDGKVTIYKRPKPAHKLRFNAPNGTRAIMGHTRMTTQGNEKFNYNNHPFYGHADVDFAFAHNGSCAVWCVESNLVGRFRSLVDGDLAAFHIGNPRRIRSSFFCRICQSLCQFFQQLVRHDTFVVQPTK